MLIFSVKICNVFASLVAFWYWYLSLQKEKHRLLQSLWIKISIGLIKFYLIAAVCMALWNFRPGIKLIKLKFQMRPLQQTLWEDSNLYSMSRRSHFITSGVHHIITCIAPSHWSAPTDWCIQWPSEFWRAKKEARHTGRCSKLTLICTPLYLTWLWFVLTPLFYEYVYSVLIISVDRELSVNVQLYFSCSNTLSCITVKGYIFFLNIKHICLFLSGVKILQH